MYSFIVLPVLALYLYIAYRAAGAAFRSTPHRTLRIVYPVLALLGLALLPFADIIYPRWKLNQLCETEAKTEILATTTLPAEFFNSDGAIVRSQGNPKSVDWSRLGPVLRITGDERAEGKTGVTRTLFRLVDYRSRKVLVLQTSFLYRGGWIRLTSTGVGAASCPEGPLIEDILSKVVSKSEN